MIPSPESQPCIEDALFLVEERSVGIASTPSGDADLTYGESNRYRAIVDAERDHVFSIVGPAYRLVTNCEALDLGEKCFQKVFGLKTAEDMVFFNLVQPESRSFCHMDFLHGRAKDEQRPEWVPFMRITNSYNRTKPLRFDVGFCRWICKNGMVFGEKSIRFHYRHTWRDVDRTIEFLTSFNSIKELQRKFDGWIERLKGVPVTKDQVPLLVCRALSIPLHAERWRSPASQKQLTLFVNHVRSLDEEYAQLGRNAYTAFNVITDVASRPTLGFGSSSAVDRLQRRASAWAEDFAKASGRRFSLERYLQPITAQARALSAFSRGKERVG